ncbi:MAG: hypothetical protein JW855_05010, partial [Gammaproteobacteria bacterium]|nr:hypothetical protein [Gammaproteobacteria bacterium]
ELSSEQFRQIIEKAIERKIPFNPACILNSRFNLEPEVVKKLVHQYLSSINEDDENLENFIRQRLMYHEHFGRNLAWLYEVLVKKPKTISKRSREYILQYLPLAANVLRANPDSVKTHRLVAEFCGFAVKKENTDKLDYLGDTGIDRTASIEAILSFKKVHEKSNRGVHRKLRSLHKTKWAGDSKFKKVWWHILNFFGKWKGKIEFSMKKNIRTGHTEDSTEYVLWRIQKGVSQLKATSTDVQVEKQRRRLAQKTAQTLRQFKKAGGKIDSAQKPQFKEGITCFFSQPTDSSTPPSKLSREERRLQQVASQLGIGVVAC